MRHVALGSRRALRAASAALTLALLPPGSAPAAELLGADLVAAARAGGRPEECGGAYRSRAGRWERARYPGLGRYCDLLASGHAALRSSPDQALAAAVAAEAALPGRAGALVLSARAHVALGAHEQARQEFARSRELSRRSVSDPAALRDLALAELATGHPEEALAAYRELVPRAELLGDPRVELAVFVEASVLAMSRGPAELPLAIGYATEARRRGLLPGLGDALLAALALALDRSGRTAEAAGVAAESSGPWWLEAEREKAAKSAARPRDGASRAPVKPALPALPPGELDAMIALLAEKRDRGLAVERWTSYLAALGAARGPFAAHAEGHRAALGRGKAKKGAP
jgi:tetratricopeptide (TPR) repeat protein